MMTVNEIKRQIESQLFEQVPELLENDLLAASFQLLLRKALDAFEDALDERNSILESKK